MRTRIRLATAVVFAGFLSAMPAVASAQLPPADAPFVREGATVKVAAHSYVIPDFGVFIVPNVGIVVGDRATLVIDPGMGRPNGEAVLREVAKLSTSTELYIASTHFHPEHTTGYVAFPATAKYINSNVQEAEFAESGMELVRIFSGFSPASAALLADAQRRTADITFDREYRLDLGGVTVRFMAVGPTHTKGDVALFVEGDGVLFSGDVIVNNAALAAFPVSSMKAWLAAFDKFDSLAPRTIVPAHMATGPGSLIASNRGLMRAIQTRALALKAEGRSIDEAAATVQKEIQAQHPDWPAWPPADMIGQAARSAFTEGP